MPPRLYRYKVYEEPLLPPALDAALRKISLVRRALPALLFQQTAWSC